jgi:tRNA U34 2-thiouridine synthase MnmA/TrmU
MSQIDLELQTLRAKLAALEQRKLEKTAFPLKTLEDILVEKKKQIERNSYSKSIPLARFYDQEKVDFLEPILNALRDIQTRLEVLEKKDTN